LVARQIRNRVLYNLVAVVIRKFVDVREFVRRENKIFDELVILVVLTLTKDLHEVLGIHARKHVAPHQLARNGKGSHDR
jgi:chorismate mutase